MKQKIHLSLDTKDIEEFEDLINKKEDSNFTSQVRLVINKNNVDEYIRHYVYLALSDLSGVEIGRIRDPQDLKFDLGLSLYHKRALRNYFQSIVRNLNSPKIISIMECEKLKTVLSCIVLVKSKI